MRETFKPVGGNLMFLLMRGKLIMCLKKMKSEDFACTFYFTVFVFVTFGVQISARTQL